MNPKRLLIAIAAAFLLITVTDFLVHGLWLGPVYKATHKLWRSDAEMTSLLGWMYGAQLLCATTFVLLWARGFAQNATIPCGILFGLFMGLFSQVHTLIMYVVVPMPGTLAAEWFVSGLGQGVALGVLTFFVYKPAPSGK